MIVGDEITIRPITDGGVTCGNRAKAGLLRENKAMIIYSVLGAGEKP